MKKRVLSLAMAVLLCVQMLPLGVFAAADPATNLCEHHTAHDAAVCGYVEGSPAVTCTHGAHTDSCYEVKCSHVCDATCEKYTDCNFTCDGSCVTQTPTGEHDASCYTSQCTHVCGEACTDPCTFSCTNESDCVTQVLNCQNTAACYTPVCSHVHDSTCRTLLPCDFTCTNEETCLTKTLTCTHVEDGSCCAREEITAVACAYSCQECTAASIAEGGTCICNEACSNSAPNSNCEICAANSADCKNIPDLSVSTERAGASTATATVTATSVPEAWTYYYVVNTQNTTNHNTLSSDTSKVSGTLNGTNTVNLTGLAEGVCYFHIYAENANGVRTSLYSTHISAYDDTPTKYWVAVSANSAGGTVSGGGEHAPGEQVTITATPDTANGYCAAGWHLSDVGGGVISAIAQKTSHTFTMPENGVNITITFEQHSYISHTNLGNSTHDIHCIYCGNVQTPSEPCVDVHSGGDGTTPPDGYCDKCSTKMTDDSEDTHTLTLVMGNTTIGGDIAGLQPVTVSNIAPGTVVDLTDYWPSAQEYTVDGQTWYFSEFLENETGGNTVRSVTVSSDLTFYAGWTATKQITITFDPNGGSLPYEKVREDCCNISDMNRDRRPTRSGYAFVGWSLENDATADDGDIQLTENCTLYAIWKDHTHSYASVWLHDASYHWRECACGGKFETAEHSGPAATATTPQTCTVCGYVMAPATGYTLTLNYAITSFSGVTVGTGSKTVTGVGSGEVVDLSQHWPGGLIVTGSDGKTYYFADFVGNSDGSGDILNSVTMDSDKTLYACWSIEKQITVLLDPNGGSLPYGKTRVSELSYADISYMNSVHKPVRSGYDFAGWSLEQDEIADDDDTVITDNCTLYAVWQQDSPSYDDGYYDPPPANEPVKIVGGNDALRYTMVIPGWGEGTVTGGVAIVDAERTLNGVVDLTGFDAEAIRLPADAVKASTEEGNNLTIKYPGGTSALITGSGLVAASDALRSGESLQIAVRPVDAGALPENLTTPPEDEEPFEDDVLFNKSILCGGSNIITEQELLDLNVIDENDDDITWNELKYLYHYMTTAELMSLGLCIEDFIADKTNPQVLVWVNEMIERDGIQVDLNTGHLDESGIRSKLEAVGYTGDGLPLGLLRQADLDMKQLEYIKNLMQEYIEVFDDDKDELILAWANEAIAQKELEQENATVTSMTLNGLEKHADLTDKQMQILHDMGLQNLDHPSVGQIKKLDLTLEQMKSLLNEISDIDWISPGSQAAFDVLLNWLEEAISKKEQDEQEADTTYINVGGERAVFVGAIEADVKAVRADGTTRNIEILADRSNAVAWSTNIDPASLEELIAMLANAAANDVASNIKAYKVLANGGLEAKAAMVTLNADGTLTASALSNGNSTYIFVLEPNPYDDVDESDWYYAAAMTMDQRLVTLGASSTSFGGGEPVSKETVWTALARLDGVIIENTPAQEWVVAQGISDGANGDQNITREQLARMLWQYAKSIGMDVSVGENTNILSYTDVTEVSEDAIPAMQWAMGAGILPDMGEELQPQREAARRETAVALTRFIGKESPHTHAWEWVTDQEATEAAQGAKHEACVCGAVQNRGTVIEEIETPKAPQPVEAPQPAAPQKEQEKDIAYYFFYWLDNLVGKFMK